MVRKLDEDLVRGAEPHPGSFSETSPSSIKPATQSMPDQLLTASQTTTFLIRPLFKPWGWWSRTCFTKKNKAASNSTPTTGATPSMDQAQLIPEQEANFLSILTFQWFQPLVSKGFQRPLLETDLWALDNKRHSDVMSDRLLENYRKRQKLAQDVSSSKKSEKKCQKFLLAQALNDTFLKEFWTSAIFKLLSDALNVSSPLMTKALIDYGSRVYLYHLQPDKASLPPSRAQGYTLAFGLFLMQLFSSVFLHQFFYRSMSIGVLSRSALISAIYKKSLSFNSTARKQFSTSQLIGHISADVSRIDFCLGFFHLSWTAPIQLFALSAILVIQIGISSLSGIVLMILLLPLQLTMMALMFSMRSKVTGWTEKRTRKTQEVLKGMKLLKLFGWEEAFLKIINSNRQKELDFLGRALVVLTGAEAIGSSLPLVGSILAFITYSATGHGPGNPQAVFTSLTLFQLLGMPLLLFPVALGSIADASNAIIRLEKIFEAGIMEEEPKVIDTTMSTAVNVFKASWIWEESKDANSTILNEEKSQPFSLTDIELEIKPGVLTAIVGPVGCGKSSLLQALMGEMKQTSGPPARFGGTTGYCPQTAWIQNDTIRGNITFGSKFDEGRYRTVLYISCLEPDLLMFPQGDMTLIGERGINLSGGQKQRINIARVLYSDPDIILFDDPLSAVDAHVGNHLFEHAIRANRTASGDSKATMQTKILVTHALHFLPKVDEIICMEGGKIQERGTFDELIEAKGTFFALFRDFASGQRRNGDQAYLDQEDLYFQGFLTSSNERLESELSSLEREDGKTMEKSDTTESTGPLNQMQEEERSSGTVGWSVYRQYLQAGKCSFTLPLLVLGIAFQQSAVVLSSYWLVWWQNADLMLNQATFMAVYASLGIFQILAGFIRGASSVMIGLYASRNLHHGALKSLLRAPLTFFDTTPLGRIMNRLSKDMDSIDNLLNDSLRMALATFSDVIGSVVLIGLRSQWFLLVLAALSLVYAYFARLYRPSARDIQRLDNLLRSRLYAHFSESLNGLTTIKAYGMTQKFLSEHCRLLDFENRAYLLTVINQQWLGLRFNALGSVLVLVVAIIAVEQAETTNPSQIGLILTYILGISQALGWMIRQFAKVENNLNSVERLLWYQNNLPQEAPARVPGVDPDPGWPSKGSIRAKDIFMSYRAGLPSVLKGVSIEIAAGEKIGVVGRTGAGKSSLMMALFRIIELDSGTLEIDGVNISKIGLDRLRHSVSIIPQDSVLFEGTIRTNIDPFDQYDEPRLWDALQQTGLSRKDGGGRKAGRYGLDSVIEDEGVNLSVGERSLVSLARALVKDSRIIVLDEATASVDYETDARIQETIRKEFKDKTLICIAHRLKTVLHYDRILVMDNGKLAEVGTPLELFDVGENGIFRSMCQSTSISKDDIVAAALEKSSSS
ncbi:hypothetical protein O181_008993 [Austropuccinia psidii MF-1]|uniref:ABC transporter n=1 Tax=Austropuccinia psidii MF-1 TaxID=1389203 RepID=A0A9Q3BQ82_9BASI|nr:hypothetical protein [Austropuccinia psidii MF-1]